MTVGELDSTVLACEIVKTEASHWEDICEGPVKFLKKHIQHLEDMIITTWSRRFFQGSKPTMDPKKAETCFMMIRVKREAKDLRLELALDGFREKGWDNNYRSYHHVTPACFGVNDSYQTGIVRASPTFSSTSIQRIHGTLICLADAICYAMIGMLECELVRQPTRDRCKSRG